MERQARPDGHLDYFLNSMKTNVAQLEQRLDAGFYQEAVALILGSEAGGGRIHVTGVGKASYVAGYIASLLSSVGTPAYFLDTTETIHGSA
ncbi:MAG: carbohydrate isomerase, partial [Oscillospiraceae bacterium]|nr:carbohydrate isomerase [Oscillospiraceae bacterium]